MSEAIDRAVKALLEASDNYCVPIDNSAAQIFARSVIETLRIPTEAILDELDMANHGWGSREHSKEIWQSLIDTMLK